MKAREATIVSALGGVMLYVLSMGPAYRITNGFSDAPTQVFDVYHPIFWVALRVPIVHTALNLYLLWWEREQVM